MFRPRPSRLLTVAIVAALAVSATIVLWPSNSDRAITVHFASTTGLYVGDDVRILDVPVGSITSIEPTDGSVVVELEYAEEHLLPADVQAAIIAPTLVTGRYVALHPPYTSGPELDDGAVIPVERTVVPMEWDQITEQVAQLAADLGPEGANSEGALSRLLDVSARNLDGQGARLHQTLTDLAAATTTLADGSGDLFETVENLRILVGALADSDHVVAEFQKQLAGVSGVLEENRELVTTTLRTLDGSVEQIRAFVADNTDRLTANLESLGSVAENLAGQRQRIADLLQIGPTTLSNYNNVYDPESSSINAVVSDIFLQHPAVFVCSTIFSLGGPPEQCQQALAPLLNVLPDQLPVGTNPLYRDGVSNQVDAGEGAEPSPPRKQEPAPAPQPGAQEGLAGLLLPGGIR
ncbi:phospholipid/cholesterol/gamma-HCH transport system substrate-binding protein [Amycolatopsis marina]|uniref:Phospholipid/cholesterol/gamma-HCH transport system substrate-binding protein n=1 Tax=Amycolatopsis marina TaxID=490629 RepID=A0A1I0YJJ8_9PSEU|nr:MCE family protein [Amycolatopsis marina]SFB13361.1 phospholipid/cholesterol/gamma-HCH transport system substrate-binding protein [Amycolatopsis marina]